jgi:hypothetical protein
MVDEDEKESEENKKISETSNLRQKSTIQKIKRHSYEQMSMDNKYSYATLRRKQDLVSGIK